MPQHNSDIHISVESLGSSKSIDVAQLGNPIDVEVKRKLDYKNKRHGDLEGREDTNQHPISAITNLQTSLDNKADSGSVPTKTSDLTNDGSGTSPFATESYVYTAINSYLPSITGYDGTVSQILTHDASGVLRWVNN